MEKGLFFIGNKRSGTSQLVRVLNLHPNIFVSHESDVIWILFQLYNHKPFAAHPWDSPRGMEFTLKQCGGLIDKNKSPQENFFAIQRAVMEKGSPWLPPMKKTKLFWVGDKKPFQCTDTDVVRFMRKMFSEVFFIHLVRHPFEVAESAARFNRTLDGDFWQGFSLEQTVERWTFHEQQVLKIKEMKNVKVLDIRFEDFCRDTKRELDRIGKFLAIDFDEKILTNAYRQTRYVVKDTPQVSCGEETRSLMAQYRYAQKTTTNIFGRWAVNSYWFLRKVF